MTHAIHTLYRPASRVPWLLDETEETLLAAWRDGGISARQFWLCLRAIPYSLDCDQLGLTDAETDVLIDIVVEDIANQ